MIFKPKIKKVLQTLSIFTIAILTALSLNTIQTHATSTNDDAALAAWAKSIVDSVGSGNQGGNTRIQYGVTSTRTGYMCYLLDKNGNRVSGTDAIALMSPGFEFYDSNVNWIANSRKGGYSVTSFSGTAPWNCSPWNPPPSDDSNACSTNEPQIKAWFESMDGNVQNGVDFVITNWGEDIARKFRDEECYLVIETLMHFKYSYKSQGGSGSSSSSEDALEQIWAKYNIMTESTLMEEALLNGLTRTYAMYASAIEEFQDTGSSAARERARTYAESVRTSLKTAIAHEYRNQNKDQEPIAAGLWVPTGDFVVGTVPELIKYKQGAGIDTRVFNSYTNLVAPFAERINPGDIGSQIGFLPWSGDTSNQITDSDVLNYGVAMMVISAKPAGQTTCDESKLPAPHAAPKESEGNVSIIKSYRTRQGTQYTDDGTYTINNISSNITIENEKLYQVVGWAISSSTSPTSSINWNPPSVLKKGTTPSSVKLDPTKGEIGLYLLLEKQEKEPQKVEDYNYLLTQSTITRRVFFSKPDNPLTNMNNPYIYNHPFRWSIPAHQTSCPGNHPFSDDCKGDHDGPHESSCKLTACSSTCTSTHPASGGEHVTEADLCTSHHHYNCGEQCQTQYTICKGWQWKETKLKLSINNVMQTAYPDILAYKGGDGWNEEVKLGGLTKHYYLNDSSFDRTSTSAQQYPQSGGDTNWDYICVLMRGKDKLTLAQWENDGQGSGIGNGANGNLRD